MLFALLCGYPPFYSQNDESIKKKIFRMKVKFDDECWDAITDEAKDLITSMLVKEDVRPSAKECLEHPWFKMDPTKLSTCSISLATLDRLKSFSKSNVFRKCVQYIIAYRCQLSEEDINRFRKLFLKIDKEMNGYVNYEDCKEFFGSYFSNEEHVKNFFEAMDIDGNGMVHWNEFFSSIINESIIMREESLREAYNFFDRENKGYFTSEDFKVAIGDQYLSYEGPHANFANVIEEAFPGKYKITFEDLKVCMAQVPPPGSVTDLRYKLD